MILPDRFIQNMKDLLGEDYPAWRDSLLCVPNTGIRVNTLKISKEDFRVLWKKCGGGKLVDIPWIHNGFFTDDTQEVSGHPLYQAGLFYIQEPSAMTPAENLPVSEGDRVLDLCAAPGGKSTELLSKLSGTGVLYSNDISASRAAALRKNLELAGAANAFVTAESPDKLASFFREYFDKILVDAPCSGEGMFRREPGMASYWEEKGPDHYADIQAEILDQAVAMLKCGGCLMYSTCTFSVIENEANVLKLLTRHPEMELVTIKKQDGFADGVLPGSEKCVRIYPHRMRGEGQFLALMRKKNTREVLCPAGDKVQNFSDEVNQNANESSTDRPPAGEICQSPTVRTVFEKNGELYLIPGGIRPYGSLRYLMTGLHVGTIRKNRLEPSQALAEALRQSEWRKCLNLACNDPRTEKYLRGETLYVEEKEITVRDPEPSRAAGTCDLSSVFRDIPGGSGPQSGQKPKRGKETKRGKMKEKTQDAPQKKKSNEETAYEKSILVLIEGYPVGFGTYDRGRLKNKRSPGRRLT